MKRSINALCAGVLHTIPTAVLSWPAHRALP